MELQVEIVKSTNIFESFTLLLVIKWIGKISRHIGDISVTIWLKRNQSRISQEPNECFDFQWFPPPPRPPVWGVEDWVYISCKWVEGSRRASGLNVDLGSLPTCFLTGLWAPGAVICFWCAYSLPGSWFQCKPLWSHFFSTLLAIFSQPFQNFAPYAFWL